MKEGTMSESFAVFAVGGTLAALCGAYVVADRLRKAEAARTAAEAAARTAKEEQTKAEGKMTDLYTAGKSAVEMALTAAQIQKRRADAYAHFIQHDLSMELPPVEAAK